MSRAKVLQHQSLPCLVTGGCGFVGRHLVRRLLEIGHQVWVVDDLSTGRPLEAWLPESLRQHVVFVSMDVREFFRLHSCPDQLSSRVSVDPPTSFGDVFHLAAVVGGRAKIEGDPLAVAQDLAIDADFFAWAVRTHPLRILYASSSAAYPTQLQGAGSAAPLREDFIDFSRELGRPDMTYGWAKLTGEYLARIAVSQYGLHVACVRPFSGYGDDQETTYPVPAIAERVVRREDPLVIWGSGDQGRDFIYVDDCIDAMLLAMDHIQDGSAINIGTGRLTTFREVAALLARIAGYSPAIRPMVDKPVGVAARFADPTKARAVLGWTPRVTLEEGFWRVYSAMERRVQAAAASSSAQVG